MKQQWSRWHTWQNSEHTGVIFFSRFSAGLRHAGALRILIIWRPLKHTFSILFWGIGWGWGTFLRALIQITDDVVRYSFVFRDLSLLAPYVRLLQWRLSAVGHWLAAFIFFLFRFLVAFSDIRWDALSSATTRHNPSTFSGQFEHRYSAEIRLYLE